MKSSLRTSLAGMAAVALLLLMGSPGMVAAQGCYVPWGGTCSWFPGGLALYTGYFTHPRACDFVFSTQNQSNGSLNGLRQHYGLQGVEVELIISMKGSGPVGFALGAAYDFGIRGSSEETVQIAATTSLSRSWRSEPQAGNVNAALMLDLYPSWMALLGFKYESFQTNFRDGSNGLTTTLGGELDSADMSFNMFNPYLGVVFSSPAKANGLNFQLGLLGFPVFLGNVDYRETIRGGISIGGTPAGGFQGANSIGEGYFLSAFGDVSMNTMSGVQLGAYVKYEGSDAVTTVNVGKRNNSLPEVAYHFEFQRKLWSVGGRLSVSF